MMRERSKNRGASQLYDFSTQRRNLSQIFVFSEIGDYENLCGRRRGDFLKKILTLCSLITSMLIQGINYNKFCVTKKLTFPKFVNHHSKAMETARCFPPNVRFSHDYGQRN